MKEKPKSTEKKHRFRRWWRRFYRAVLICLGTLTVVYGAAWFTYRKVNADVYQSLPVMDLPTSKTALVLAPHCDDETLTNSILIKRLMDQGTDVHFAIMTNGDGFTPDIMLSSKKLSVSGSDHIRLGLLRQQETLNALSVLDVSADNVRFFGYPDRGCGEILLFHWDRAAPYFDPWTQSTVVPYPNSYGDMPTLAGENIVKDLSRFITDIQPDLIIMPHPGDQNVDHAALNTFMQVTLGNLDMQDVRQVLYLTHHALNSWPQQLYPWNAGPYLVPPKNMRTEGVAWTTLPITAEEKQLAHQTIAEYYSQMIVDNGFLHSFIRDNQLFASYHQPVLAYGKHADAQIVPSDENRLITGSSISMLKKMTSGGQTIKAVYGEISTEGSLHLMLQLHKPPKDKDIYQFMLLLGDAGGNVTRSTITVNHEHVHEMGKGLSVQRIPTDGEWVHISIPYAGLEDIKTFLLYGSICDYESVVNATIWQSVKIPAQADVSSS